MNQPQPTDRRGRHAIVQLLLALITLYQRVISPLLPATCRYLPTCSNFTAEALRRHGAWKGSLLGIRRICSCHPWGGHGLDPVPDHCSWLGGRSKQDISAKNNQDP